MKDISKGLSSQLFPNGYQLVNGVAMRSENPGNFQIPPDVIKRHVKPGQFVELRINSPRFSMHEDAAERCSCPSCNGEMAKPILRHSQPYSLVPLQNNEVPSRGWGEDFWVIVRHRMGSYFSGIIDNRLAENRLHGLDRGNEIFFHEDHVLAVHNIHRTELVAEMDLADLKELARWVGEMRDSQE